MKTLESPPPASVGSFLLPEPSRVLSIASLSGMEKLIEIALPGGRALQHKPGQFVEVSLLGTGEAPISICSSPSRGKYFQICVRNAGNLTAALHKLQVGESIGVRGPFGRGFPIEKLEGKDLLVVAGGLGLAPVRSLIQYVFDHRKQFGKFTLLVGAKSPQELLFLEEVRGWRKGAANEVLITVDRAEAGWKESVGVVTVLFNRLKLDAKKTAAVVVGPPVMFKFVLLELLARKIPEKQIYVSLERRMKCGIGKCGHCQMGGYYVCKEGPVFSYDEVAGCAEAFDWKKR